ncbi:9210_t:CDS:2 [Ambispora leptoticha]|uniref:9210_t:CDS:1 n=1 Tax=Ambispora leptoticha TaxID=144679 RepID=A0A9N9FP75_9GLOM|nr:9210_t:CDS:2 [Ambispora leptoticha]
MPKEEERREKVVLRQIPTHNNYNAHNSGKYNVEDYLTKGNTVNSKFAKMEKRQRLKASSLPLAATPPRQQLPNSPQDFYLSDNGDGEEIDDVDALTESLCEEEIEWYCTSIKSEHLTNVDLTLLKKRESKISKSMDTQFEISKSTIIEMMKRYLEKEEKTTNKVANEYKSRMNEHDEQKIGWLKKLQLEFEEYQKETENLLEALEKNYTESLRHRREFDKEIEQILHDQEQEVAQIQEKILDSSQHIRHALAAAAKAIFSYYSEVSQRPNLNKQLHSLFK